jgi:hypothetical protein
LNFKWIRCAIALSFVFAAVTAGFSQNAGPMAQYTASTANTSSPGDPVRFSVLRWSTDAERDQLLKVLEGTGDMALLGVLQKAPTIGYIWTTETAGYPLRYAFRDSMADGGERIVLAIDRQIGSYEPQRWKLSGTVPRTDYPFTVIELRISKSGLGEGKASLNAKIVADKSARTIALDNYAAVPFLFQSVKK